MRVPSLLHEPSGAVLAQQLEIAANPITRGLGLMFRRRFERGRGLWISPCNGIHMFFMNFAIDAVFVDRELRVVKTYPSLGRWRIVPLVLRAHSVFELPAGTLDGLAVERGHQLQLADAAG
jgi:uncharacterized membrane protein (UPF0127 family)